MSSALGMCQTVMSLGDRAILLLAFGGFPLLTPLQVAFPSTVNEDPLPHTLTSRSVVSRLPNLSLSEGKIVTNWGEVSKVFSYLFL